MNQRAYSALEVKAVNEDRRIITGLATSPVPDRAGDIVDQFGAKYAETIPLFLYHDSRLPVGTVKLGRPTSQGIPFEASIPKVAEAGALQTRVDEAWQMVKYKLIAAVSIGFREIAGKVKNLKDGGLHFLESEILELSLVPIPMQSLATIHTIKSFDAKARTALGIDPYLDEATRAALGHTGGSPSAPRLGTKQAAEGGSSFSLKGKTMQSLQEQLNALRTLRTEKAARMTEIAEQIKAGTDIDATEFDGLEAEVTDLDNQIRVKRVESMNASAARPVEGTDTKSASQSRGPTILVRNQDPEDKFKGQSYVRGIIARAQSFLSMKDGNYMNPGQVAEYRWGKSNPNLVRYIKAAVAGGGTGSGEWGAELAAADTRYTGDFVEFLYSLTVFDRLPLRSAPERVHIKGQDGAATGYWVGESKAIPASKPDFSDVELTPLKVGALAVCSKELVMSSSPSAEMLIRDSLAEASAQRVDTTFLSDAAASAGVSPAGILNGLSPLAPSGTDAAAVRADMMSLYSSFLTAKNASGLVQIMTPSMAKALALLVNALGQPEFVGLNANGGSLLGDPVFTGDNVTPGDWILMKPSDIWKIGDSGVQVSMSDQATIEQNDAPAGATDTPVAMASHFTSMFQSESVAFKVVRHINYKLRRAGSVAVLSNAEYGGVVS